DLEGDAQHAEARQTLTREIHTLKGEAKMMGFADVNLVAHRLEDMLKWVEGRNYDMPDGFSDLLFSGLDTIGMLMQKSSADGETIDLHALLRQFDGFLANHGSPVEAAAATQAAPLQPVPAAATLEANADAAADADSDPVAGAADAEVAAEARLALASGHDRSRSAAGPAAPTRFSATAFIERAQEASIRIDLDKLDHL